MTAIRTTAPTASLPATRSPRARMRRNGLIMLLLALLTAAALAVYLLWGIEFSNRRLFSFSMSVRLPKAAAMLVSAYAVGASTVVFQTIASNRIITPGLLGMNALYTLIHTVIYFLAGSSSLLAVNATAGFAVDLLAMSAVSVIVYGLLFRKTGGNVLYVLLIGTVLSSLFGSVQSTLIRVMDPNEYDALLNTIIASFSHVRADIIAVVVIVLTAVPLALRRDLAALDVLALGRDHAINLGVDYDRCIRRLLVGVALYVSASTAMVGPVSFMGLIVANLAHELLRTHRHSQLILGSALLSMAMLIVGQTLMERVFAFQIPVSVFITIFGGAYFLYLLLRPGRR